MKEDTPLFQSPVWGWHPQRQPHTQGYTLFRKSVTLTENEHFRLAVSADNRFTFFLDGNVIGRGPLRGDLDHYFYDEYQGELAPGEHIFAAEVIVWNSAWRTSPAPWAEIHAGGGFMIAGFVGDIRMELPDGWLTCQDDSRKIRPWNEAWASETMIPAPPMDEIFTGKAIPAWNTAHNPAGDWLVPVILGNAVFRDSYQTDPDTPWNLTPRPLEQMLQTFTPIAAILQGPNTLTLQNGRLTGTLPPGRHRVLVDLGRNQTSMLSFSGRGGNGTCRIAYSETLFDSNGQKVRCFPGTLGQKGYADLLHFSTAPWRYDSFWYRTGRFIELDVSTDATVADIELALDFITYPLGEPFPFKAPQDPALEHIWKTACHTLLCCTHEHFEDCPYYEQLQYAGDSRVEALVSYAVSGNDVLGRHALNMIAISQQDNGLTQSRYPSVFRQVIPGYCLIWALMLHDHFACFHDTALVKALLPNVRRMLEPFEANRRTDGLIGPMPGWHYTDWVPGWSSGALDRGENIPDTVLNLFYAEACAKSARLLDAVACAPDSYSDACRGTADAERLRGQAKRTLDAVNAHCFNPALNRYLDSPGKNDWLSLHANVLAILFGAVPEDNRHAFLKDILQDGRLAPMSLYFSFYLLLAIQKYGSPHELRRHFAPWESMLAKGCTTFPETPRPCRSDCHAWSCAPAWFLHPLADLT